MKKFKNGIIRFIKGIVIGVAAILPGASGGVLAVAMGIYRQVLDALNSLFKNFKKNVLYLAPIGIGALIGLLSCSRAVEYLMTNFRRPVMWALIGMVAGGIPSLIKDANGEGGFKAKYLIGFVIGAGIIGGITWAQYALITGGSLPFNGWTAALCGALIGFGTVIPGISTSFIMMYLGIYEPMLNSLNTFNVPMLLCAVAGGAFVVLGLIKLVKKLFDSKQGYAYYGAFGLLLTSVVLIFPGFGQGWQIALDAALFIAFFIITYLLCKLSPSEK